MADERFRFGIAQMPPQENPGTLVQGYASIWVSDGSLGARPNTFYVRETDGVEHASLPYVIEYQTPDNTPVDVIIRSPTVDSRGFGITVDVVGYDTTADETAHYKQVATFKIVAGVVSLIGTVTALHTQEEDAAWDATLSTDGISINVTLTGDVTNSVDWRIKVDESQSL